MSELSSGAFALVRAGRAGLRPSVTDRQRVSAALSGRLGSAAVRPDELRRIELAPAGDEHAHELLRVKRKR